jgi:hypothetical protein
VSKSSRPESRERRNPNCRAKSCTVPHSLTGLQIQRAKNGSHRFRVNIFLGARDISTDWGFQCSSD